MAEKYKHDLGKVQLSGSEFPSLNYVLVLRLSPEYGHSNCRCSKIQTMTFRSVNFNCIKINKM